MASHKGSQTSERFVESLQASDFANLVMADGFLAELLPGLVSLCKAYL